MSGPGHPEQYRYHKRHPHGSRGYPDIGRWFLPPGHGSVRSFQFRCQTAVPSGAVTVLSALGVHGGVLAAETVGMLSFLHRFLSRRDRGFTCLTRWKHFRIPSGICQSLPAHAKPPERTLSHLTQPHLCGASAAAIQTLQPDCLSSGDPFFQVQFPEEVPTAEAEAFCGFRLARFPLDLPSMNALTLPGTCF